jgi:hypothetical protein
MFLRVRAHALRLPNAVAQLVTFSNKHLQCICTVFGVAL